jgi:hypothetical protein
LVGADGKYTSTTGIKSDGVSGITTFTLPTAASLSSGIALQAVAYNNAAIKSGSKLMIAAVLMTVLSLLTL